MKFVSDKTVGTYVDRLHALQEKIAKKRTELRTMEKEAEQLQDFMLKQARGKSFECVGKVYRKVVTIGSSKRMILDQEECKKLLKARTPYKESAVRSIKVDYVYED